MVFLVEFMMWCWKMKNIMVMGIVMMSVVVSLSGYCVFWLSCLFVREVMFLVSVVSVGLLVDMMKWLSLFQDFWNDRMMIVMSVGVVIGSIMDQKIWNVLVLLIWVCFFMDFGIDLKKFFMMNMLVVLMSSGRIILVQELKMFSWLMMRNFGMSSIMVGIDIIVISVVKIMLCLWKWRWVRVYLVSELKNIWLRVMKMVMIVLFMNYDGKLELWNRCLYVVNVYILGMSVMLFVVVFLLVLKFVVIWIRNGQMQMIVRMINSVQSVICQVSCFDESCFMMMFFLMIGRCGCDVLILVGCVVFSVVGV